MTSAPLVGIKPTLRRVLLHLICLWRWGKEKKEKKRVVLYFCGAERQTGYLSLKFQSENSEGSEFIGFHYVFKLNEFDLA